MPDFSMCVNRKCPLKSDCYRYGAEPNKLYQVYSKFTFKGGLNIPVYCNNFKPYPNKNQNESK